jgi:hypothetical protein
VTSSAQAHRRKYAAVKNNNMNGDGDVAMMDVDANVDDAD